MLPFSGFITLCTWGELLYFEWFITLSYGIYSVLSSSSPIGLNMHLQPSQQASGSVSTCPFPSLTTPPCWPTSCSVSLQLGLYLFLKYWESQSRSCSFFLVSSFFSSWPHLFSWGIVFPKHCLAGVCAADIVSCVGPAQRFAYRALHFNAFCARSKILVSKLFFLQFYVGNTSLKHLGSHVLKFRIWVT